MGGTGGMGEREVWCLSMLPASVTPLNIWRSVVRQGVVIDSGKARPWPG